MKKESGISAAARVVHFCLRNGILPGEKGKGGKGIFARKNKSGMAEFRYRYDGTVGGNNRTYTVARTEGGAVFTCEWMGYPAVKTVQKETDAGVLERLNELYAKYRVYRWDGYSKYHSRIRDGKGFSFSIKFCDGGTLDASGMNAFPARYHEFCEEMSAVLDPIREELLAEAGGEDDGGLSY